MLAVSFSSYAASSAKAAVPEQGASIPTYQWRFLSASERAAVNASLEVIRHQRIKNITLNIADENGQPDTGPSHVAQDSTSFIYFVGYPDSPERPTPDSWSHFLALDPSRSILLWAVWRVVEPQKGIYNFRQVDESYDEYARHGIVDFHASIGPYLFPSLASSNPLPDWAKSLDFQSLEGNMTNYVHALVSHFKGRIQFYHLWTEANAWYGNDNWPIERIIDIIKMEAATIRAIDSNAKICINLQNFSPHSLTLENQNGKSNWTTEDFVQKLMAAGVPFDVIGLETHYGTGPAVNAGGIDTLYNRLIELGRLGKPIYVWEDGLESFIDPKYQGQMASDWWEGPWHGTPSEAKQAEYMVAETLVYLGNPSMLGIKWQDLVDEGPSHPSFEVQYTGVMYGNGKEKQAFYALRDLCGNLTVNETVQSVNGVATFRGLAGNYSVSVKGYEVEPSVIHVSEGNQNAFSLVVRSTARTITSITTITPTTSSEYYTAQTPGLVLPMSYMEYLGAIVLLGAIAIGAILISGKRARIPAAAKKRPSRGVQFCINCGVELPLDSKFCGKCGAAQT
jgi:hypothetical protein